jgi:hypothetical protein
VQNQVSCMVMSSWSPRPWADQDCGLNSDFSWSHLWSHSRRFSGVRSGLPSLGSGVNRPNRTGRNYLPQNYG